MGPLPVAMASGAASPETKPSLAAERAALPDVSHAVEGAAIAAARREIALLERKSAMPRQEIAILRVSTSWRVTAPLRAARDFLRSRTRGS